MHFVEGLPQCEEFHTILVVVDQLSNMQDVIPGLRTIDIVRLNWLFLREVVRHHGFSAMII
jgi:hypothetical protein